eukprot:110747-Ditylum_brightwellii.AAC.1
MLKSVHIEVGDREVRQLVRERKKYPIRSTQKIKSVQAKLTEIMKKYRKGFRGLKIRERQKRIDMMARDVMYCCLGRDNLSGE